MAGLFCTTLFAMTMAEALVVANNPSKYCLRQVVAAVEQLRPPPVALPANPTPRFIAENPSRYSVLDVMRAIDALKKERRETTSLP